MELNGGGARFSAPEPVKSPDIHDSDGIVGDATAGGVYWHDACFQRCDLGVPEASMVPILLWLLGVPVGLILIPMLLGVVSF
jgi:hypothetical protein